MAEVESTLIWNNSARNPPQYFVENNWVVCLLSCISQSGSPFTLICFLTTTKRNCLDLIVDEYYKPLHRKFFKIMYIYSQSKSFDLLPSFKLETIVGFVTKQRHTSRFLTEFTSCSSKMPCYSLPCWEISWPDEVHHFFLCTRNPRVTTVTAFNKSMAEVNCVSLKDLRTFCHATRFRFSHKILKVSSVDSL